MQATTTAESQNTNQQSYSPAVSSARADALNELATEDIAITNSYQFNVVNYLEHKHVSSPELCSLWYAQIFEPTLNGLDELIETECGTVPRQLEKQFNKLLETATQSRTFEQNLEPLVQIQNTISKFNESETGELTVTISLIGPKIRVAAFEGFVKHETGLTVTDDTSQNTSDEAALRQQIPEMKSQFNDWSGNRPRDSFRHTLFISISKQTESMTVSIKTEKTRIKPKLRNRILSKLQVF